MSAVHTQTPTPPKRPRRALRLLIGLTLLTLLGVAALETARWQAERLIGERLIAEAGERGWSVTWSALRLGRDLTLTITDLSASDDRSTIKLVRAVAAWDLRPLLLDRDVEPHTIDLQGLSASLDRASLDALKPQQTQAPPSTTEATPPGRARRLLDTRVNLTGGIVTLKTRRPELPRVRLDGLQLSGAPATPSEDDPAAWSAAIEARCVEGCGADPLKLSGELWRARDGAVGAAAHFTEPMTIAVPLGDSPLAEHLDGLPATQPLHLRGLSLTRDARGALRATAESLSAPLRFSAWRGDASLHLAQVTLEPGQAPRLTLTRPELDVTSTPYQLTPPQDERPPDATDPLTEREVTALLRAQLADLRERLEAALRQISEVAPRAVPPLSRVIIAEGALRVPELKLAVTAIQLSPTPGGLQAWGTWEGMRLGAELRAASPHVALLADAVDLKALADRLPLELPEVIRELEGRVSARFTIEAHDLPLPDVHVVNLRTPGAAAASDDAGPPEAAVTVAGHLELEAVRIDVKGLAPEPIEQERARLDLRATAWWPQPDRGAAIDLSRVTWTLPSRAGGDATLEARWAMRRLLDPHREPQVEIDVWLPSSDCAVAIGAIPKAMLSNLHDQLQVEGRFAPRLEFSVDMDDLYTVELDIQGLPGACQITELGRFDPSYLSGRFKQEVREGVTREGIFVGPDSGRYVPLFAMPRHLRLATYMTEEPRFYHNKGFDLGRTAGAIRLNLKHGRYVYGGSTLTQQLVKNLFLTRQKTLSRKLEEAFIVWKIEEILPKNRILELYLNCIEFGPNLYGIGRASWYYFGKPASRLTVLESAFLAGIKPQPSMGVGPRALGRTPPDGFWPERLQRILSRMGRAGFASKKLSEPYVVYFKTWKGPKTL